jgi:hypothetical protein
MTSGVRMVVVLAIAVSPAASAAKFEASESRLVLMK